MFVFLGTTRGFAQLFPEHGRGFAQLFPERGCLPLRFQNVNNSTAPCALHSQWFFEENHEEMEQEMGQQFWATVLNPPGL